MTATKTLILIPAILALAVFAVFAFRVSKDIRKKLALPNTYAIQNVATGKRIRVRDASTQDGADIISYSPHNWECMTWQFIRIEADTFLLNNLYTQKSFQPSFPLQSGATLSQQAIGGSALQHWEFVKQSGDTFLIRLRGSEFYLTATSDQDNSAIILLPRRDANDQRWKLVRQNPWI